MKKKAISIVVITILFIISIVLGGCGKKEKNENLPTTTPPAVETTTEPTTETTTEPTTQHIHNYSQTVTTEPACEKQGVKLFTCECGESYTEDIEAIGHIFSEYVYNNDATYIADGTETATCVCGVADTRIVNGTKLEYTYKDIEKIMFVKANVNVMDLPSVAGEKVGQLEKGEEIFVTGICNETGWYRFEYHLKYIGKYVPRYIPADCVKEKGEEPVETNLEFGAMLKELHAFLTYEEREAYIDTLDKSKYKIDEVNNFDLITQVNGIHVNAFDVYDMDTGEYTASVDTDSDVHYPSFNKSVLGMCIGIYNYESEMPTGEAYLMTITNIATGETDPWGVKIHKAGTMSVEEETEWGSVYTYVIDPESDVTVVACTIEDLIYVKNDYEVWEDPCYARTTTVVSPVVPEEKYDDNWQPTGEFFVYETSVETIYVKKDDVLHDAWGFCYIDDEFGFRQYLDQDDNGEYYYVLEKQNEISLEERGYKLAYNENFGNYLLDKDGNIVTESSKMVLESSDQDIATWDTLKYYDDIYNPLFMRDFAYIANWEGMYGIAEMKAEDYSYLDAADFDALMKRYMEIFDIVIDEEMLDIKDSIPKEWDEYWYYEEFCDKKGEFLLPYRDEDYKTQYYVITIVRPENWFFNNDISCELAVKDDNILESNPAHYVIYDSKYKEIYDGEAEPTEDVVDYLLSGDTSDKKKEDISIVTVNDKQVFSLDKVDSEGNRNISVLQDIGEEYFVAIEIKTHDTVTEAAKLVEQFLLIDNYSMEPWKDAEE